MDIVEGEYECHICGQTYGRTGCSYRGVEIWVTCDCSKLEEDKVYLINRDSIRLTPREVANEVAFKKGEK